MILGLIESWFPIPNSFNLCTFYFYRLAKWFTVCSITTKNSANNKMLLLEIFVKNNEQIFVGKALLSGNYLAPVNGNRFKLWFEWFSSSRIPTNFSHNTYSNYFYYNE